jgi:hypothetical protein
MPREKGKRSRQTGSDALENGRDRIKGECKKINQMVLKMFQEREIYRSPKQTTVESLLPRSWS